MLEIRNVTKQEIIDFFISDPRLCEMGLSDVEIVTLQETREYLIKPNSTYHGVYDGDRLLAVSKSEWFTNETLCFHLYVTRICSSEYRAKDIHNLIINTIKEFNKISKVICMVPSTCRHVSMAVISWGWELEGRIKNSITWRHKLVDVLIYSLDLNKGGSDGS